MRKIAINTYQHTSGMAVSFVEVPGFEDCIRLPDREIFYFYNRTGPSPIQVTLVWTWGELTVCPGLAHTNTQQLTGVFR